MKKKLLSLLLAASMLSALCACGSPANSGSAPQSAPESKAESAAAPETEASAQPQVVELRNDQRTEPENHGE